LECQEREFLKNSVDDLHGGWQVDARRTVRGRHLKAVEPRQLSDVNVSL